MSKPFAGMPLLTHYSQQIPTNFFVHTNILYVNHVISDSLMVARALYRAGAHIWFVGTPYGSMTSPLRKENIAHFKKISTVQIPLIRAEDDYNLAMQHSLVKTIKKIGKHCQDNHEKFLVVEDGGYAFPLLHDHPALAGYLKYCIGGVEHTARGMWNYQFKEKDGKPKTPRKLQLPAVTIADSTFKTYHEPFFVAQATLSELYFLIKKTHDFLAYKPSIVMGYGRIGKGIAKQLCDMKSDVVVIEENKSKYSSEKSKPKMTFRERISKKVMQQTQTIIGATGTACILPQHIKWFLSGNNNQLILASASSKRVEFASAIEWMEKKAKKNTIPEYGSEYEFIIKNKKKKILLMGEGYPTIFYAGNTNGGPNKPFDPVMTQLFLAACYLHQHHATLESHIYTLKDIYRIKEKNNIARALTNEWQLLKKWCKYNQIPFNHYQKEIGFPRGYDG